MTRQPFSGEEKQDVGAKRAERLGEVRRDAAAQERLPVMPRFAKRGNQADGWEAKVCFDFFRRLDTAVEVFEEKGDAACEEKPTEQRERQAQEHSRRRCLSRHLGAIDHTDIARLELPGDAGFPRPLHQALVNLAAALYLALEDAVFDRLAIHGESLGFLLVEGGGQAVFLGQGRLMLGAHRLHDLGDFRFERRLGVLNCRSDLHHVRVPVAEPLAQLSLLPLESRKLRLLLLDERVAEDRRERVEQRWILSACFQLSVRRLLQQPLGLGTRHGSVHVSELLHHDVLPILE